MIAVLMRSSHGPTAYPFDEQDQALAGRFAAFLTAEVDPAEVGPDARVVWASPITELLNYYEAQKRQAVKP